MDMGQTSADAGTVDVGNGDSDGETADMSQGGTVCITIVGGKVTVDQYAAGGQPSPDGGQPMDIAAAMDAVLDLYEQQKGGDTDNDDAYESGLSAGGAQPAGTM